MKKNKIVKKKKLVKLNKTIKRRKRNLVTSEQLPKLINKAQVSGKQVKFSVLIKDTCMIENILNDLSLNYKKIELKRQTNFLIKTDKFDELTNLDFDLLGDIDDNKIF